jgi:hypothetical protein
MLNISTTALGALITRARRCSDLCILPVVSALIVDIIAQHMRRVHTCPPYPRRGAP